MIIYGALTPNQEKRKGEVEARKLAQAKVEKRSQLMLGELSQDNLVFHPRYGLGYIHSIGNTKIDVNFVIGGYVQLVPLGHNERVLAWAK